MRSQLQRMVTRLFRSINEIRLRGVPGVTLGGNVIVYGMPMLSLHPGTTLTVGASAILCSQSEHTALALNHPLKLATVRSGAAIRIGGDVGISGGTMVAAELIEIGDETLIGANVTIIDTDFHPVASTGRRHSDDWSRIRVAPVRIGRNVFIGANAIILKGTTIGDNGIVAAGSVVRGQFGDNVILAGNPARAVGIVPKV